jgi:hypothetical protein
MLYGLINNQGSTKQKYTSGNDRYRGWFDPWGNGGLGIESPSPELLPTVPNLPRQSQSSHSQNWDYILYIYTYIYNNTYYIVNPKQNGKVDPYSISGESLFYLFWWVIVYIYCNIYIYIPIWTIHDFIWNGRRASSMRFGNGWCMLVRWVTCCTTFWVCCPRSRAITVRTVGQL